MTLITILICLALQRYMNISHVLHKTNWLSPYTRVFQSLLMQSPILGSTSGIILFILPLVIITGIINYLLQGLWYYSLEFLFHLLILFYCLDAHNLHQQFSNYFSKYSNGTIQECHYDDIFDKDIVTNDTSSMIREVTKTIFLHADQAIFAVLFWYVILGPAGAMLYYSVSYFYNITKHNPVLLRLTEAAFFVQAVLDWLPVRIAGLSYALVGHFGYAFTYWWRHLRTGLAHTKELAFNTGLAALELDNVSHLQAEISENQQALVLVDRALVLWLVVIAIFTLGAWIS